MHFACGGELASEGAAAGIRGVDDSATQAGSWQGWPGVEGVRAQELGLHAVHRERRVPVSSLVRQSLVFGAMFACLSRHWDLHTRKTKLRSMRTSQSVLSFLTMLPYPRQPASMVDWTLWLSRRLSMKYCPQLQVLPACEWIDR